MSWPFTTHARRKRELGALDNAHRVLRDHEKREITALKAKLTAYEKRWGSADGKVVLNALQDALNLIRQYQITLDRAMFSDPQIGAANELLRRWGMKPESKLYLGALSHPQTTGERPPYKSKLDEEMERWGDEAFANEKVEIQAERTLDGDRVEFRAPNDPATFLCPDCGKQHIFEGGCGHPAEDYEGEQVESTWHDFPNPDTRITGA